MDKIFLFIVVVLPIVGGVLIPLIKFKKKTHIKIFIETLVIVNTLLIWGLILQSPEDSFTLMRFTGNLHITFRLDGMAKVFAGLVSTLWPLATLYTFEYMTEEKYKKTFYMFYVFTYGVTMGIALSANPITMYLFYELLTLATVPLVLHTLTREAVLATRKYLYYSLGGAAFAFIGLVFISIYGTTIDFTPGGVLDSANISGRENILLLVYVFTFFGFGVKAAICPFNSWLPQAGVAPTPVTALLHAVAVVKSGAFAIMRITYYSFGTEFLKGTWAQTVVMSAALITIVYGCSMAVKERHIKRRLAYSTISNLSYILFGVTIMTPLGLVGALSHMVFHAVIKICAFFCAGAIIHKTGKTFVYELDGLGRKMPKVFGVFTICALALMGVPGLCGFVSKFYLAKAAVESQNVLAYVGIGALLISAFLTAVYMLTIVVRAFFPQAGFDYESVKDAEDPNWLMWVPLFLFAGAMIFLGVYSGPVIGFFEQISGL